MKHDRQVYGSADSGEPERNEYDGSKGDMRDIDGEKGDQKRGKKLTFFYKHYIIQKMKYQEEFATDH